MSVKPFIVLIWVAAAYSATAQHAAPASDTVLKGSTIEVLQSYKPQVKQAPKPEWIPQLPPADTAHPTFNYDVPQQTLYYTYNSLPLRPLALGKDITPLPFPNYVKVGGGNLGTLFLDAGIGGIKGDNYETAIHVHHISQSGQIKDQQTALSGIEAEGVIHTDHNDWRATVSGERSQYSYYGGDQKVVLGGDSIQQVYLAIGASIGVRNKPDSNTKFSYDPALSFSVYNAKFNANETTVGINAPFVYQLDPTIDAEVALKGAFTNYNNTITSLANNYMELLPGVGLHTGSLSGHALLGLAVGSGASSVQAQYILPDVLVAYSMEDMKFSISGGWQAALRQNTYEQLSTENPFMYYNYQVMQTRTDEVFVKMQGSSGDHLSYSGKLSWWKYNELPTFLDTSGDQKKFYVVYDANVNAISFSAAMRYHVANTWSFGITGDFNHFYNGSESHAWEEPATKIKGDFAIIASPKLTFTVYLALLGGIYAKDISNNVVKLNMITDLGGNAEYQVVKRLSAFVQLNNLLNDKYQRWYGYEAYGLNIYGGVRLKF